MLPKLDIEAACRDASRALESRADPEKAVGMQAYMKTEMPFYGVQKPGRTKIVRELTTNHQPASRRDYERLVRALWRLPHREEKYLAVAVAQHFDRFVVPASLPLYKALIRTGAWWDFVDDVATHLVRELIRGQPGVVWAEVDRWIDHDDLWLRRSAIICQIGLKEQTDERRLLRFCRTRAHETGFFIRKAIGWALREYAKTRPEVVAGFCTRHRGILSPLSLREATKHIQHLVT